MEVGPVPELGGIAGAGSAEGVDPAVLWDGEGARGACRSEQDCGGEVDGVECVHE